MENEETMVLGAMENETVAYVLHHYCQQLLIQDDHLQDWVEAVRAIVRPT